MSSPLAPSIFSKVVFVRDVLNFIDIPEAFRLRRISKTFNETVVEFPPVPIVSFAEWWNPTSVNNKSEVIRAADFDWLSDCRLFDSRLCDTLKNTHDKARSLSIVESFLVVLTKKLGVNIDTNMWGGMGVTPFAAAVEAGNIKTAIELVKQCGANPNQPVKFNSFTPGHILYVTVARFGFVNRMVPKNEPTTSKYGLSKASSSPVNDDALFEELCSLPGLKVEANNSGQPTVLDAAVALGTPAAVKLLLIDNPYLCRDVVQQSSFCDERRLSTITPLGRAVSRIVYGPPYRAVSVPEVLAMQEFDAFRSPARNESHETEAIEVFKLLCSTGLCERAQTQSTKVADFSNTLHFAGYLSGPIQSLGRQVIDDENPLLLAILRHHTGAIRLLAEEARFNMNTPGICRRFSVLSAEIDAMVHAVKAGQGEWGVVDTMISCGWIWKWKDLSLAEPSERNSDEAATQTKLREKVQELRTDLLTLAKGITNEDTKTAFLENLASAGVPIED